MYKDNPKEANRINAKLSRARRVIPVDPLGVDLKLSKPQKRIKSKIDKSYPHWGDSIGVGVMFTPLSVQKYHSFSSVCAPVDINSLKAGKLLREYQKKYNLEHKY